MHVNCVICTEAYTANESISCTPCGHLFHTTCLQQWLYRGQSNCPQCRRPCSTTTLLQVFLNDMSGEEVHAVRTCAEETKRMQTELLDIHEQLQTLQSDLISFKNSNEEFRAIIASLEEAQMHYTNTETEQLKQTLDLVNVKFESVVEELQKAREEIETLKEINNSTITENNSDNNNPIIIEDVETIIIDDNKELENLKKDKQICEEKIESLQIELNQLKIINHGLAVKNISTFNAPKSRPGNIRSQHNRSHVNTPNETKTNYQNRETSRSDNGTSSELTYAAVVVDCKCPQNSDNSSKDHLISCHTKAQNTDKQVNNMPRRRYPNNYRQRVKPRVQIQPQVQIQPNTKETTTETVKDEAKNKPEPNSSELVNMDDPWW